MVSKDLKQAEKEEAVARYGKIPLTMLHHSWKHRILNQNFSLALHYRGQCVRNKATIHSPVGLNDISEPEMSLVSWKGFSKCKGTPEHDTRQGFSFRESKHCPETWSEKPSQERCSDIEALPATTHWSGELLGWTFPNSPGSKWWIPTTTTTIYIACSKINPSSGRLFFPQRSNFTAVAQHFVRGLNSAARGALIPGNWWR